MITSIDTVILDIDGVLVDVSNSYRSAIKDTLRYVYDGGPNAQFSLDDYIQELKNSGGFNNDWDVTYALAFLKLVQERGIQFNTEALFNQLYERGTGLTALDDFFHTKLNSEEYQRIYTEWDKDRLNKIFQEFYLGEELYRKIEDQEPQLNETGYIYREEVLIEDYRVDWLKNCFNVGILTGRPAPEAEIALQRTGLVVPGEYKYTMDDWEASKPDPDALLTLSQQFQSERVVFVGDTLDDIRTVKRAESQCGSVSFFGLGVMTGGLTGENGKKKFREVNADAILSSINDLPDSIEPI